MKHCFLFVFFLLNATIVFCQDSTNFDFKKDSINIHVSVSVSNIRVSNPQATDPSSEDCCGQGNTVKCFDANTQFVVPTKYITYDLASGDYALPHGFYKLKLGDAIKVKIVNLNPLLYGVSINSKDSSTQAIVDVNSTLPWLLNPSNLSGIVSSLESAVNASTPAPATPAPSSAKVTGVPALNPPVNNAKSKIKIGELENIFKDNFEKISKELTDIETQKRNFDDFIHNDYSKKFNALKQKYPSENDFLAISSDDAIVNLESHFKVLNDFIDAKLAAIQKDQFDYYDSTNPYTTLISKKPYSIMDTLIKSFYSSSLLYLNQIDSTVNYKILDSLESTMYNLRGLHPCFTSGTFLYTKDEKSITVQIKAWGDSVHNPVKSFDPIQLPIAPITIWGVSAGIYTSSLHNKEYTNLRNTADTNYHLISDNSGDVEIGINAMAYYGFKIWNKKDRDATKYLPSMSNYRYLGLLFGGGMSFESKPKPRVFIGAGYINGYSNRIMISGGLSCGFVDRLSSAYNEQTSYQGVQSGYIKQVLCAGAFISINYSFLNN